MATTRLRRLQPALLEVPPTAAALHLMAGALPRTEVGAAVPTLAKITSLEVEAALEANQWHSP